MCGYPFEQVWDTCTTATAGDGPTAPTAPTGAPRPTVNACRLTIFGYDRGNVARFAFALEDAITNVAAANSTTRTAVTVV